MFTDRPLASVPSAPVQEKQPDGPFLQPTSLFPPSHTPAQPQLQQKEPAEPETTSKAEARVTPSTDKRLPIFFVGATAAKEQVSTSSIIPSEPEKDEAPVAPEARETPAEPVEPVQPSEPRKHTIKVFGFPPNLIAVIHDDFSQLGDVETYRYDRATTCLELQYKSVYSVDRALKRHGTTVAAVYQLGVAMADEDLTPRPDDAETRQNHVRHVDIDDVYASSQRPGSGKAGVSVLGTHSIIGNGAIRRVFSADRVTWLLDLFC
ncbi:hypothetical protein BC940DRAFT_309350 [Gongronella butleri]|nr:hypothetical protein BC940DRAFT_309350 [Gongronella butleri]